MATRLFLLYLHRVCLDPLDPRGHRVLCLALALALGGICGRALALGGICGRTLALVGIFGYRSRSNSTHPSPSQSYHLHMPLYSYNCLLLHPMFSCYIDRLYLMLMRHNLYRRICYLGSTLLYPMFSCYSYFLSCSTVSRTE